MNQEVRTGAGVKVEMYCPLEGPSSAELVSCSVRKLGKKNVSNDLCGRKLTYRGSRVTFFAVKTIHGRPSPGKAVMSSREANRKRRYDRGLAVYCGRKKRRKGNIFKKARLLEILRRNGERKEQQEEKREISRGPKVA